MRDLLGKILCPILGALSWLMLFHPPVWWVGFAAVMAALILSWRVLRSQAAPQATRRGAAIGLALAAAAAAVCVAVLRTGPEWAWA